MHPALENCLGSTPDARPLHDLAAWWACWQALGTTTRDPAALAIAGGFAADRVAWAFAGGYQAALRALVSDLAGDALAAFCVTEAGGNRPRDIGTTFTPLADGRLRIDGAKRWTTLGPAGTVLLVVGVMGPPSDPGRPALRVARVPVPSDGLVLTSMPPTRFVPEVPHAELRMQDLRLGTDALLPGDGYTDFVKPFRTLEDLHVALAVLAYLLREARLRRWPVAYAERLVAALLLLSALAKEDARSPAMHIALAGALQVAHGLYAQALPLWADAGDDPGAERWRRDSALFEVASSARRLRAQRAWERVTEPS